MRNRARRCLLLLAACLTAVLTACGPVDVPNQPNETAPVANAAEPVDEGDSLLGPGIGLGIVFAIAILIFHRREKAQP